MDKATVTDIDKPSFWESTGEYAGAMVSFWMTGLVDGAESRIYVTGKAANADRISGQVGALLGHTFTCVLLPKGEDDVGRPKYKVKEYPGGYNSDSCEFLDDEAPVLPVATKSEAEGKGESPAAEPRRPEQSEAPPRESRKLPSTSPPSGKDSEIRKAVAFKGLVEIATASDDLHTADGRLEWVVGMMNVAEEALL
jgi:hypothetical protein